MIGIPLPNILDRWACKRAAAKAPQRKRPCCSRATARRSLTPSFFAASSLSSGRRLKSRADTTSALLQSVRFLQRSANLFTQSHCRADFLLRCHEVTTRIRGGHDKQISPELCGALAHPCRTSAPCCEGNESL